MTNERKDIDFQMRDRSARPELFKLDPDVKRGWVEALRSGRYAQGTGRLSDSFRSTYCCIGVLCDLKDHDSKHNWLGKATHVIPRPILDQIGWFDHKFEPEELDSIKGVDHGKYCEIANITAALANANDAGATFSEIADWIEANL